MEFRIVGAEVLIGGRFANADVHVGDGAIGDIGADRAAPATLDATDLTLLPGIVDVHGDAFERQMMPRPGVHFATDVALIDSDRQAIANGITTVFHGVTWSWEPGLRGTANARKVLEAIETLGTRFAADTRFHLRHETYNFDAESEIADWLGARRIHAVAFNDHLPSPKSVMSRPEKIQQMVDRSGMSREDFLALIERLRARTGEVPAFITRIAKAAVANGVPLLSHDDASPEQRRWFRSLGCRIVEFPVNVETAREAVDGGDSTVMGAPNVMRGGSHIGWVDATTMVRDGLCTLLASDYYYPAPLMAACRLAAKGVVPLAQAWRLVSESPARALTLTDRGRIDTGLRADLVLIDASNLALPRVVAVVAAGRIVHLTEGERLAPDRTAARGRAAFAQ